MRSALRLNSGRPERQSRGERGFSIIEMMVAVAIMMAVTGAVFSILNPAQGTFQAQPEVSDMQQRLRVGVDTMMKDIIMAGAGTYQGVTPGALYNFFAPIMPYRAGGDNDDPSAGVYWRSDTISLLYVPPTSAQTSIAAEMPANSAELKVTPDPNCPAKNGLCNFKEGMKLMIFNMGGAWDTFTITEVQNAAAHLQHRNQQLNATYGAGSAVTQVAAHTYYLKTDNATSTYQLMHFDGDATDLPVVDNVVKLEFEYFGDPLPPRLLPNICLTANCDGPWTTYGPKPPAIGVPNAPWADGENCAFQVVNGAHTPRLETLDVSGTQVKLSAATLQNGPWCPQDGISNKFDADLLRVRRVRVKLRVQASLASMRGPAGVLFLKGGTSSSMERYIPDQEIQFDVTPRNMNLGR